MSFAYYTQELKEARRDALVNHYLATHDFGSYQDKITTADDLYEYLLLDTKISDSVTTSPLSEAVNSLQLCIHRAIEGYDGELVNSGEVNSWFASDAFLDNWGRYNKRYSTWAGKEKLRFYAGNYVEPSLRTNKTQLFKNLENSLSQGKLTNEAAVNALFTYIASVDKYINIEFLCSSIANQDKTRLYVTGRVNEQYYWREILLDTPFNKLSKPVWWGCWQLLPATITTPIDDKVVMLAGANGPSCLWRSVETVQDSSDSSQDVEVSHSWVMNHDGTWEKDDFMELSFNMDIYVENEWSFETKLPQHSDVVLSFFNLCELKAAIQCDNKGNVTVSVNSLRDDNNMLSALNVCSFTKSIVDGIPTYKVDKILLTVGVDEKKSINIPFDDGKLYGLCGYTISDDFNDLWDESPLLMSYHKAPLSAAYWEWGSLNNEQMNIWLCDSDTKYFTVGAPFIPDTLSAWLEDGIGNLLDYNKQKTLADAGIWYYNGATSGGDAFSGPYGQYLWEIFFHVPYLIATRFTTEQRFEEAERWYKYIFNSAGYRDEDGKPFTGEDGKTPRYWNCYPLQQDSAWDALVAMPASTDPDIIAMADPMHYKLSIFLHTLDLLIERGDAAYRMLERDTLTEAKMYYIQAQQLLGARPDIRITNTWDNPTLGAEAGDINNPIPRDDMPLTFAQWLRAGDRNAMGDGQFLPPYNDVLLAYWDKLDVRLFNLRHNLSLTGQPLNLPLFSTPADPAQLHRQQSGGDSIQGEASLVENTDTGWRYPLLADHARNAASQLTQFGSSLLNALERRDSEQLTLLLQTQQIAVLSQQQDISQKNLDSLSASLTSLNASLSGAQMRRTHYGNLINGDLSAAEIAGLTLRSTAMVTGLAAVGTAIAAGVLSAAPNTFGLANGGGDFGAPLRATSETLKTAAGAQDQSAVISEVTAGYLRRAEDWKLQRDLADNDVEQLDAQIKSLQAQIAMQQKQMRLTETESANAQAVYDLQSSRFTGQVLYNWMVSRLSGLYYQLYDATVPVCLQACNALKRELGKDKADGLFGGAVWNDLYQGLLAGEGLTTELQKLNNVWLQHSALGMEATRTVSLADLRGEASGSLSTLIGDILDGGTDSTNNGTLMLKDGIFSATLDMSELGLEDSYNDKTRSRFIKSISVTLPTLLGPYQDIEATLSCGEQMVTLSHGMQDTGRFVTNFDDSRFLPFEGMDPTTSSLILSIFNVKGADGASPNQRAVVENLSDIIFHIHYILR